jgi:hypothetical protein
MGINKKDTDDLLRQFDEARNESLRHTPGSNYLLPEIQAQEKRAFEGRSRLESIKNRFVTASGNALQQWYRAKGDTWAKDNRGYTLSLPTARDLVAEYQGLSNTAMSRAAQVFSDPTLWWHLGGEADWSHNGPGSPLRQSVARMCQALVEVFKKYRYPNIPDISGKSASREGWTSEMDELLSEYERQRQNVVAIDRELVNLRAKRQEKEVEDLLRS